MQPSDNPYAPPKTVDYGVAPSSGAAGNSFFAVSPTKLVLMSVATLSLYLFYWMYKNWRLIKVQSSLQISPFWRTVFSVFFINNLFTNIRMSTINADIPSGPPTAQLTTIYIVCAIGGNLASRLDVPFVWLISFGMIIPIALIQREVQAFLVKSAPGSDLNTGYSAGNIVALVIGGLLWVLIAIGTFLSMR